MAEALTLSKPLDGLRSAVLRWRDGTRSLVRSYPREAIGAGVLGFVSFVALGSLAVPHPGAGGAQAAPPAPPPLILQPVAPQQAIKVNAEIPLASGPNPAAAPFVFKGNAAARTQALNCLASAVYYEAGNQDADGERAVAQVILNQFATPPSRIASAEWSTRARPDRPAASSPSPATDRSRASRTPTAGAAHGRSPRTSFPATSTHRSAGRPTITPLTCSRPGQRAWPRMLSLARTCSTAGPGSWGRPAAFTDAYSGREPNAAALRTAALAVPHVTPVYGQQEEVAEAIKEIPGAEAIHLAPSMRGDKRVAVRFNLAAREASKDVAPVEYEKKFEVSDNLKYALSPETVGENQQPLGKASPPAGGGGAAQGSPER